MSFNVRQDSTQQSSQNESIKEEEPNFACIFDQFLFLEDTATQGEVAQLIMLDSAIVWLEMATLHKEAKEHFRQLRNTLHECMLEAYEEFINNTTITKGTGERINKPNENDAQRYRSYCHRLMHIRGGFWDCISDSVDWIMGLNEDDKKKRKTEIRLARIRGEANALKSVQRVEEKVVRVEKKIDKGNEICAEINLKVAEMHGKYKSTKKKQRKAGKKAYLASVKARQDKYTKPMFEKAFQLCHCIILSGMERNGRSYGPYYYKDDIFAKQDSVFQYVVKNFEMLCQKHHSSHSPSGSLKVTWQTLKTKYHAWKRARGKSGK